MKKTIYNVAVLMDSQETCDRMKQLCIDNGLPIWGSDDLGWHFNKIEKCYLSFDPTENEFYVFVSDKYIKKFKKKNITESEFIELLKEHKLCEQ